MGRVSVLVFLFIFRFDFLPAQIKRIVEPDVIVFDSLNYVVDSSINLKKLSLRGLSVYSDNYMVVSGTQGVFGKMEKSGTVKFQRLLPYAKSDFRDIEIIRPGKLLLMSSGFPALVLSSDDDGLTWKESLRSMDSAVFLDGMEFWNQYEGVLLGDPIEGRFLIYHTRDGGKSWQELPEDIRPEALPGEACFAASGTALRCFPNGDFAFVSGGAESRFFYYSKQRNSWQIEPIPIQKGKASQGCFSFTYVPKDPLNKDLFCFVGGDYLNDSSVAPSSAWYRLKPPLWFRGKYITHPAAYRSAVECLQSMGLICTGPTGVDFCPNKGVEKNWFPISKIGFHSVRQAKRGNAVYFSGSAGRIGKLEFKKKKIAKQVN